jgi:glycosyltransferase involved in cell wall biosynthesis
MKIFFMACHPTQASGYSRVANKISNHLASIPGVEVVYFGFQNYKHKNIADRFVDPRIKFYDPYELDPEAPLGFGDNIIVPTIISEKPDVIFIYNDMIVVSSIMDIIPKEHMPLKKYVYLDIVYPWESVEVYEKLKSYKFDRIWVFLDYWKKHLIEDFNFDSTRVSTMVHGIDFERFVDVPIQEAKVKLGFKLDDFLIINLNRNSNRKRLDITIMAFLELLIRENMNSRLKLFMSALLYREEGHDILQVIKNECMRLGLDYEKVCNEHMRTIEKPMCLTDEHINLIYNAADIGMNTCCGEGFGLTTLEHIFFNRPQVVSGVPALKETLGTYAHFVEPKLVEHTLSREREGGLHMMCDYVDFVDKLQHCFRNSNEKPDAREYVKQNYSWNKMFKVLDEEFR